MYVVTMYVRTYGDDWDDDGDADGDAVGWPIGPGWLARWTRMAGRFVPVGCPVSAGWLAGWPLLVSRLAPGNLAGESRLFWPVGPGWLAGWIFLVLVWLAVRVWFGMHAPCTSRFLLLHQGITYVYPYVVDCTLAARTQSK